MRSKIGRGCSIRMKLRSIPAGAASANIEVSVIDDQLVEGTESVIISVLPPACVAIYPPPPDCYMVGIPGRAEARIVDNDSITNPPPRTVVSIVATDPEPGTWTYSETGPRHTGWNLRTGIEYPLHPLLMGRAGYIYRSDDFDEITEQNEQLANTVTLGLGLTPEGTHWRLDTSYAIDWWQADYGTPASPRGTRQMVTAEIGWQF